MDPSQLVQLLSASLDGSDPAARQAAEHALQAAGAQPGFAPLLAQASLEAGLPVPLRQLALVLLKNTCNKRWQEGERGFEPPQLPEADKARVREALPAGLAAPESKIRTAAGAAVAAIYNFDGDSGWPGLTEALVAAIQRRADANQVSGSLRCLCLMAQDLDEERKPRLLAELSAPLHAIVGAEAGALAAGGGGGGGGAARAGLVRMALRIMAELVAGLELMEAGAEARRRQRAARDAMAPLVGPWVNVIAAILELPFDGSSRHLWGCKLEALRLLMLLVRFFSKHMESAMPGVMAAAWQMLSQGAALHQALMVEGDDGDDEAPVGEEGLEEGEALRLETVLSQLFELLLTLAGSPRHQRLMAPALPELAALCVGYSQMSGAQEELWGEDANALLADEEGDIVGCRPSAEILIDQLLEEFGPQALAAVLAAVKRKLAEADEAAARGAARWYRLREAALLVLGNLLGADDGAPLRDPSLRAEAGPLVGSLLQRELLPANVAAAGAAADGGAEAGTALLVGRALWLGAKLHPLASAEQKQALLQAAVAGVSGGLPLAAKVGALRALAELAPAVPRAALQAALPGAYGGLLALLGASSEESMHLVLGTLAALVQVDTDVAAQHVMQLAGPVLKAWSENVADPLVADEGLDVLRALAGCPRCLPELARHALPTLVTAVQNPRGQAPMVVESYLNLLEVLAQPSAPDVAAAVCREALPPAAALLAASDDPSEASAATALLVQLLRAGGPNILHWGPPGAGPDAVQQLLCATAARLLDPRLPDGCSAAAGDLLVQMTKSLGSCPPELVAAAAAKLASGPSPRVAAGLVPFFARLALADARQLLDLLAAASVPVTASDGGGGGGGEQRASALAAALPALLEAAPDVAGGLATRQAAAALGALLAQRAHPALAALVVRGAPVDAAGGGRVTRSAARRQGGLQYTQVSAAAKLVHVLGQLLASADEDDAWAGTGLGADSDGCSDGSDGDAASDAGAAGLDPLAAAGRALGGAAGERAAYASLVPGGGDGFESDVMARSLAGTPAGEDPEDASDPLAGVPLRDVVRRALAPVAAADAGFLQAALAGMPPDHAQAIATLLS